jgi:hypothetical protein
MLSQGENRGRTYRHPGAIVEFAITPPERSSFYWWKVLVGLMVIVLTIVCITMFPE